MGMDIDEEYAEGLGGLGAAGKNIVGPGQGITSSKEFMRYIDISVVFISQREANGIGDTVLMSKMNKLCLL